MAPPRMTAHTLTVLRALAARPGREMYGLQIVRVASLPSGTVYPLLDRTEAAGWIEGRDEDIDPKAEGRPRRRYYRITPAGEAAVREAMERDAARLAALGAGDLPPLVIGGIEIPVIVDDRQPPGIVSLVAPGEEVTEVRSFPVEPGRARKAAKGPCPHRVRPGAYCKACGRLI